MRYSFDGSLFQGETSEEIEDREQRTEKALGVIPEHNVIAEWVRDQVSAVNARHQRSDSGQS